MTEEKRSVIARLGIVLLNVPAPGLGLMRAGDTPSAIGWLAAPVFLFLAGAILALVAPVPSFKTWAIAMAATLFLVLVAMVYTMVRSWRMSRVRRPLRSWGRWYGIVGLLILSLIAYNLAAGIYRKAYSNFSIPSVAMQPTLQLGDLLVADMRIRGELHRGDVVLFRMPQGITYIKRIAALPGDRIAMIGGVPRINGRTVDQTAIGTATIDDLPAQLSREKLAGEAGDHLILDTGHSTLDDMPERVVPPNNYFVLGDNRDQSADSRLGRDALSGGVGWVPAGDVQGRPLFIYWSDAKERIGQPVR